jgi:diguanylate cyclase (GGDEF)-like protein
MASVMKPMLVRPLPGVTKLLAAMMAVPMMATVGSTTLLVGSQQRLQRSGEAIVRDADRLEVLTALNVGLRTESSMAFLMVAVRKFNVPIAIGSALVGIDVPARLKSARSDVDQSIATLGSSTPILADSVMNARVRIDAPSMVNLESDAYAPLLRTSVVAIETQLSQLRSSTASFGSDPKLLKASFATEHSVRALSIGLDQVGPVSASAVGVGISDESTNRMAAATTNLRQELEQLAESTDLPADVSQKASTLLSSPDHQLITKYAVGGKGSSGVVSTQTRTLMSSISIRSEALIALSKDATRATASRARILASIAGKQVRLFVAVVGIASALSVAIAFLLGRIVSRSLHRLEQRAQDLVGGSVSNDPLPINGPRELAVTAAAINQLVAEYAILGKQAAALAEGHNTDETFSEVPEGPLGKAVHEAVRRLATTVRANEHTRLSLKYEATHDALTGLLNRAGIYETLEENLQCVIPSSLIFIDLDRFKKVNDSFGHFVGDEVLRQVGERLQASLREGDVVGRLGGDEFVMICRGTVDEDRVAGIAQRVVQEISHPFRVDDTTLLIGASVGVARSVEGDNAPSILARADASLYRAKSSGRGRVDQVREVSEVVLEVGAELGTSRS